MKRIVPRGVWLLAAVVVVAGFIAAVRATDDAAPRGAIDRTEPAPERGSSDRTRSALRSDSSLAEPRPRKEKSPPLAPEARARAVYTPDPTDGRALVGLGFRAATDAERERLRVPDRFGRGAIITSLHPDAPAVLSGLRVDDVIVRALQANVDGESDLEAAIGDRAQTVLTVSRGGRLFRVVLHKPFVPDASAR